LASTDDVAFASARSAGLDTGFAALSSLDDAKRPAGSALALASGSADQPCSPRRPALTLVIRPSASVAMTASPMLAVDDLQQLRLRRRAVGGRARLALPAD
jgi:hypothetical protein